MDKDLSSRFLSYFLPEDTVIIAPLNWGLGHASRCIPLIRFLKQNCHKVIIASDGGALHILSKEFPDLETFVLPGYDIRYHYDSIFLNILKSLPFVLRAIMKERLLAKRISKITGANVILSDNRPGFRVKGLRNFYLTHQINILHNNPVIASAGTAAHQWFIKKFDVCFVPDYNDKRSLCPELSASVDFNTQYLGPLTRIRKMAFKIKYDICVILSGPEPQRTILEELLLDQLSLLGHYKILFVRGTLSGLKYATMKNHIDVKNLLTSADTETALNSSRLLISRSGYSTIMDIYELDIKAIFIPTPGQTEQEYLAEKCKQNPKYHSINQNEIKKLIEIINSLI